MLINGRTRKIAIDDYVMAALSIYLDIINLFIEILKIIAILTKDDKDKNDD